MNTRKIIADPMGDDDRCASGEAESNGGSALVATGPLPNGKPLPLRYQLKSLRFIVVGLIIAYTLATLVHIFELAITVTPISGDLARFKAIVSGDAVTLGAFLQVAAELACVVASLVWQYRATRNTAGLSSDPAVISPKWAVLWWFIPVMFFYKPFIALGQLWRISDSGASWRSERTPGRLMVWWGLFWLLPIVYLLFVAIISDLPVNQVSLEQAQAQFLVIAALELATLIVAGLWADFVNRITDTQHAEGFQLLQPTAPARASCVDLMTTVPTRAGPSPAPAVVTTRIEKTEAPPEFESADKTWFQMNWKAAAAVIAAGLIIKAVVTRTDNSPEAALRCVKLKRQSTYVSDMLHFVNSCSRPLNIRQCDKIVVAEFWELLGGEKAKWNCTESYVPPGGIGATSLEARKDNSLLVTAFTNSRWRLEACFAPKSPVSLNDNKYQCK